MKYDVRRIVRDWLYPRDRVCPACTRPLDFDETMDGILCGSCSNALKDLAEEMKNRTDAEEHIIEGLKFLHCAFPYMGRAKLLIYQLKFYSVRRAAEPLIEAMKLLPADGADLVIPMPTTRRRKWERGYNQTELIAGPLAKYHKVPYRTDVLRRIDDAASQTKVKPEERKKNVVNSMRASSAAAGRRILLVDDVYTTGATAAEAVRALKEAGCSDVGMLAVCRAGRGFTDDDTLPY